MLDVGCLQRLVYVHQDCHKTGAEKAALLAELFKLPRYTSGPNAGKPMGMGKLEIKHKVAPGYISRSGLLKNLMALKPLETEVLPSKLCQRWRVDTVNGSALTRRTGNL